jgi:hypothetical protein
MFNEQKTKPQNGAGAALGIRHDEKAARIRVAHNGRKL